MPSSTTSLFTTTSTTPPFPPNPNNKNPSTYTPLAKLPLAQNKPPSPSRSRRSTHLRGRVTPHIHSHILSISFPLARARAVVPGKGHVVRRARNNRRGDVIGPRANRPPASFKPGGSGGGAGIARSRQSICARWGRERESERGREVAPPRVRAPDCSSSSTTEADARGCSRSLESLFSFCCLLLRTVWHFGFVVLFFLLSSLYFDFALRSFIHCSFYSWFSNARNFLS